VVDKAPLNDLVQAGATLPAVITCCYEAWIHLEYATRGIEIRQFQSVGNLGPLGSLQLVVKWAHEKTHKDTDN
jgi:hypothetical protein